MSPHEEVALRVKEQVLAGNVYVHGVDFHADFARGLYVVTVKVKLRGYHPEADIFEHEVFFGPMSDGDEAARAVAGEWKEMLLAATSGLGMAEGSKGEA